jgi:transposase
MEFSQRFIQDFPENAEGLPPGRNYEGKPFSPRQKLTIIEEYSTHTAQDIATFVQVSLGRIKNIIHAYNHGSAFATQSGNLSRLDEEAKAYVKEKTKDMTDKQRALTRTELEEVVNEAARQTHERRGFSRITCKLVSSATFLALLDELDIHLETGQSTTVARANARRDVRNFLSMIAMNYACSEGLPMYLVGNMDATHFIVSNKNGEVLARLGKFHDDEENQATTHAETTNLNQGVKWMVVCDAAGHVSDNIFVIADSSMDASKVCVYKVLGLTHLTDPNKNGYLVVTRKRGANLAFFKWLVEDVIIPFTHSCRDHISPDELSKLPHSNFYLTLDGEEMQCNVFDDKNIIEELERHKIIVGKGPASCTGFIGNALDVGPTFKATKASVKNVKLVVEDPALENRIRMVLKN